MMAGDNLLKSRTKKMAAISGVGAFQGSVVISTDWDEILNVDWS